MLGFHLDVPMNECIRRAEGRMDHPTLNGKDVVEVILKWVNLVRSHRCMCPASTDKLVYVYMTMGNSTCDSVLYARHVELFALAVTVRCMSLTSLQVTGNYCCIVLGLLAFSSESASAKASTQCTAQHISRTLTALSSLLGRVRAIHQLSPQSPCTKHLLCHPVTCQTSPRQVVLLSCNTQHILCSRSIRHVMPFPTPNQNNHSNQTLSSRLEFSKRTSLLPLAPTLSPSSARAEAALGPFRLTINLAAYRLTLWTKTSVQIPGLYCSLT